jgi:hypothetical protein
MVDRFRLGIAVGPRFAGRPGQDCQLNCALSQSEHKQPNVTIAVGVFARAPVFIAGHAPILELANYISERGGKLQHELQLSIGLLMSRGNVVGKTNTPDADPNREIETDPRWRASYFR